jgi:hypothetical protein
MERECPLPFSQKPTTGHYPELDESHTVTHYFCNANLNGIFRLRSVPPCRLLPSDYPIKLLNHLPSPRHTPHVLSIIHYFFNGRVSPHW